MRWGPHLEAPLGRISLHLHELAGSIQFLPALELEGLSSSLIVDPKPHKGPSSVAACLWGGQQSPRRQMSRAL